jgi:hypothetical protein
MRTDQDEPLENQHFPRRWNEIVVTGPAVPAYPAHGVTWHAGDLAARQEAVRRAKPSWQRAERQWRAHMDDRETGYRRGGDR